MTEGSCRGFGRYGGASYRGLFTGIRACDATQSQFEAGELDESGVATSSS